MRILMAFHAPPWPPEIGPSRRHYHVLTEALKRHEVTVLSLGGPQDHAAFVQHFGDRCRDSVFVPKGRGGAAAALRGGWHLATGRSVFRSLRRRAFQRALDDLVATRRFDLAYFSTTMLGCYRLPANLPLVGDTHNVEHDNLARAAREAPESWRRGLYRAQAALTRREELPYSARFSMVCTTSERDRSVLEALLPDVPMAVVPNGIDVTAHQRASGVAPTAGVMLFTGLMSYYPNEHGVRRFVARVLPRILDRVPGARLQIVGANPGPAVRSLASRHVEVTGRVPDVRPYYLGAELAVIPLWIGGGTRVKALEAMAMGVPIVSTPLGCEGLDVRDGRSVLFGDSDEALAGAAIQALTQPSLRSALVSEAMAVAADYDWRRVGLTLEAVFRRVTRTSRTSSTSRTTRSSRCTSIADTSPAASPAASTSWTDDPATAAATTSARPPAS